ncbi:MAG: NAD(P)H-dependent glycerol-3-phosphate dehydrogenase, partial [Pseudomonadota bacterium]
MMRVRVIGAGAFGTALAAVLARAGHEVLLEARREEVVDTVMSSRCNPAYLGDIILPPMQATADANAAVAFGAELIVLAVPAQTVRSAADKLAEEDAAPPVILAAKGIDRATGQPLSDLLTERFGSAQEKNSSRRTFGVLSGPSFATDIALGLPTAVALAAPTITEAETLAAAFAGSNVRCYASDDVRGVELGGALKNVLAIGAGIVSGRELGASAQAALVTRGLVEMRRLAVALGARAETLNGLSGLGDLILTCASTQSRNFSYGVALARDEITPDLPLAEGAKSAQAALKLAQTKDIDV